MTIDAVAAELEIRNVIAALAQFADTGTVDEYVNLFTDDGVWEMPANPANGVPASNRTGRAEIAAGVHDRRAAGVQGPGSATRHVVSTIRVMLRSPDEADAQVYFQYFADTTTEPRLLSVGHYEDRFHRTPEGWKLARRRIVLG